MNAMKLSTHQMDVVAKMEHGCVIRLITDRVSERLYYRLTGIIAGKPPIDMALKPATVDYLRRQGWLQWNAITSEFYRGVTR